MVSHLISFEGAHWQRCNFTHVANFDHKNYHKMDKVCATFYTFINSVIFYEHHYATLLLSRFICYDYQMKLLMGKSLTANLANHQRFAKVTESDIQTSRPLVTIS